ncbi:MAG: cytochrome c3 family protein [Thermoguttaceae bacterium]|nr:cytochrome c3 family protein [Thermoguttaceae bacterium]MDW8080051.1 cytochrome c3 family protein [Thermoguttaceae bacterium]
MGPWQLFGLRLKVLPPVVLVVACALALSIHVLGAGQATQSTSPGGSQSSAPIYFPPEGAVVRAGKIIIIGRDSDMPVWISNKPTIWQYRHLGLAALEVALTPGKYVIGVGDFRREINVVDAPPTSASGVASSANPAENAPVEPVQWHPMSPTSESCEACHRGTNKAGGWPSVSTPDACFPCHTSVQLEAIHAHPMEHLHHCQDCHHMHAAPKEHLLIKPPKELCRACHES